MICLNCHNKNTDNAFCDECSQELTLIKRYDETTPYELSAGSIKALTNMAGMSLDNAIKFHAAYKEL